MTEKRTIVTLCSAAVVSAWAIVIILLGSLAPSQAAHAANGQCHWEGGPGEGGGYGYCFSEDCAGQGGNAQCTAAVGASPGPPDALLGPDKFVYHGCDEAAGQMWRIAAWCEAAGGDWVVNGSDPDCINLPSGVLGGGGTITSSESQITSTAQTFANGIMGSCGAYISGDTGWNTTIGAGSQCYTGGTTLSLGIPVRSLRRQTYTANSPCTGTLGITFLKQRAAKCPPNYKGRNAVSGPECFKPVECCLKGNPVSPISGAKVQEEVDYVSPGRVGLELVRYYNSSGYMRPTQLVSTIPNPDEIVASEYWRYSYSQRLYFVTGNTQVSAIHQAADGSYRNFDGSGNEIGNVGGGGTKLQAAGTQWEVILPNHDVERFDASGRLISITTRTGLTTTIANVGCTRVVTGPFGHALTLTYDCADSERLLSATLPGSGVIQYAYDDFKRPTTVTYPDLTTKTYEHTDARNQWLLTGIRDESIQLYASYVYDDQGRATSSQHAGGAQAYTFNYANSTVTDPAGKATQYTYAQTGGTVRVGAQSQPCMDCGGWSNAVYDAQGNLSSETDFNGTQTLLTFDPDRNLQTWRTEAAGTPQARVITTQWHPTFRLPTQIDEPGRRTGFTYDADGNVLTKTETDLATSASRTWTYTYDTQGKVLTSDGPRTDVNDVTTLTYNSCTSGNGCGQVATLTDPVGNTTSFLTYDNHGNPLTISDSNGLVTTYTYDARQRITSIARGIETATIEYWPTGLVKKKTAPDGSFISFAYDAAHRLTGMSDELGNSISYTLNAAGQIVAENVYDPTNTLFHTRTRVYDNLNRLQAQTGAASQAMSYGYDDVGNLTAVTDPLERTAVYDFDALRRVQTVTNPIGGTVQYSYDARGNLLSVTDPRQLQTSYTYNGFNDLVALTSPDSGAESFTRDDNGDLESKEDARGSEAEYTRDAVGRITQIEFDDHTIGFTYDTGVNGHGHLTAMTDESGSSQFEHDVHGRMTSMTQTTGSVVRTAGQTYNSFGQLATMTTPSGQVITYTYASGRISGISANGTTILSNVIYAPFGPTLGWQWGNGTYAVREYDLDGRIVTIDSAGLTTYTYNADGTIQSRSDDAPSPSSNTDSSLLLNVSTTGNRLVSTTAVASSVTRTYSYDAAGNTTSDGLRTFTYNGAGQLSSSSSGGAPTGYTYNGFGQRVKKTGPAGTFYFVYDEAGHLLGQYDAAGALVEELVWLGNIPVATIRTSTSGGAGFFYIHTDNLNTPTRLTRTSDNAIMWRWDHDPYGAGTPDEDADGNGAFVFFNARFPGQQYDPESGMHYNYFRDYDPHAGRYLESDPLGLKGGLNTYSYAKNRPVSAIDPSGLFSVTSVGVQRTYVDNIPGTPSRYVAAILLLDDALGRTQGFLGQARCSCVGCGSEWMLRECSAHLDIRVLIQNGLTEHAEAFVINAEAQHVADLKAGVGRIERAGNAAELGQMRRMFTSKAECERESSSAVTTAIWAEREEISKESANRYDVGRFPPHSYHGSPYK